MTDAGDPLYTSLQVEQKHVRKGQTCMAAQASSEHCT